MHFTFQKEIDQRKDVREWTVSSRGTQADHNRICPLVGDYIRGLPGGEAFIAARRPMSITAGFATGQHLLLTATRAERSFLATLSPETRARTFTIREATWLGEAKIKHSELVRATELVQGRGLAPLEAYADLLHGRRGLSPIPTTSFASRIGLPGAASHPLDIRDGHNSTSRAHTRTLRQAVEQATLLAKQLTGFVDALR